MAADKCCANLFREEFKRYKRRDKPCDFRDVLETKPSSNLDNNSRVRRVPVHWTQGLPVLACFKPIDEWKAYELTDCPGFIIIPNPFRAGYQRFWVKRCAQDYPKKPNATNLDALMERPDDIWSECQTNDGPDLHKESLLMKLRWATLGFHFDYNKEEYYEERQGAFPNDLSCLAWYVAAALGYPQFHGEAGIVNFYRLDSAMGGHTDHSELDHEAPLVSFSFGQDAVFLIGGLTKATRPVAVFLHSGDISVMTGASRLAYHAVPRMVPADNDELKSCFLYSDQPVARNPVNTHVQDKSRTTSEPGGMPESWESDTQQNGRQECGAKTDSVFDRTEETSDSRDPVKGEEVNSSVKLPSCDCSTNDSIHSKCDNDIISDSQNHPIVVHACDVEEKCPFIMQTKVNDILSLNETMERTIRQTEWSPLQKFLSVTRVNCNVRQVLQLGQTFPKKEK